MGKKVIEFTLICGLGRSIEDKMVHCPRKACKNCKELVPKTEEQKDDAEEAR